MTVKSILEIDVNAEGFDKYNKNFSKYSERLKSQSDTWKKVNQGIDASTKFAEKNKNTVFQINEAVAKQYLGQKKINVEAEKFSKVTNVTKRTFGDVAKSSFSISKSIAGITFNLLKWGSVIGLAGATGSLFGIGSLASSGAEIRRKTLGVGVTAGELNASRNVYGQYANVDSLLSNINLAKNDITKKYAFNAIGVNPEGQSTAQLMPQILEKFAQIYKSGSEETAQQRVSAYGAEQFGLDIETIKRFASLSAEEKKERADQYQKTKQQLEIQDKLLKQLADVEMGFNNVKDAIGNQFMKIISENSKAIQEFSKAVGEIIVKFLGDPKVRENIKAFADNLVNTSEKLEQWNSKIDGWLTKIDDLFSTISKVTGFLEPVQKFYDKIFNPIVVVPNGIGGIRGIYNSRIVQETIQHASGTNFQQNIYDTSLKLAKEKGFANPEVMAQLATTQAQLETGGKSNEWHNLYGIKGKGTRGSRFLMTKEFIDGEMLDVEQEFAKNFSDEDSINQYLDLMKKSKRYARVANAKTTQEAFVEVGKSGYATAPDYSQKLTEIHVKLFNNTGGSVNATAGAMQGN